jgi:hypothetical protein
LLFRPRTLNATVSPDPVSLRCKEKVLQKIGSQFVKWPRLQFLRETFFGSFLVEKPPKTSVSIFICYLTFCNNINRLYIQQKTYVVKNLFIRRLNALLWLFVIIFSLSPYFIRVTPPGSIKQMSWEFYIWIT